VDGVDASTFFEESSDDEVDPRAALAARQPLAAFTTNAAGSAIVNAVGPIRQIVQGGVDTQRRYLVIAPGTASQYGASVQVQTAPVSQ
jgi:hypothetical protein